MAIPDMGGAVPRGADFAGAPQQRSSGRLLARSQRNYATWVLREMPQPRQSRRQLSGSGEALLPCSSSLRIALQRC